MTGKRRNKSASIIEEYSKLADSYDQRWSFYINASVRETLSRLKLIKGMRILDIGCGTGAMLKALSELDPSLQLSGIDPVTEMLAVARRNLPIDVNLEQAWAEEIPFASRSFDVVISCNMFHYVRKPEEALDEVKRVLVPNGELILTDWCDDYLSCKLCELYLRLFNSAHYKAYSTRDLRILLSTAKFELASIERYKINWLWGLMTAKGRIRTQSY